MPWDVEVLVLAGGNDERERTLNQLLVEMDGFDGNSEHHYLASLQIDRIYPGTNIVSPRQI